MRYEIEITRVSYSTLTFGVEANSEEEAREKALDEARNTSFDEDDADGLRDYQLLRVRVYRRGVGGRVWGVDVTPCFFRKKFVY